MTRLMTLACLLITSFNVHAADLTVNGGQLMGATGVEVNGNLYDVEFLDGSCIDIYGGCDSVSDFTFSTASEAEAASQAILDLVFIDGTSGTFDSVASSTFGCGPSGQCAAITPYGFNSSLEYYFSYAVNRGGISSDVVTSGGYSGAGYDTTPTRTKSGFRYDYVHAKWQVSQVPLPAAAWLFGSGLLGLVGMARRKKT